MKTFLSIVVFSLLVIALFSGYSSFGIPQVKPAPPPVEEKLDLGAMTVERFVALGERIYEGKGTCTLCHNPVGGRAPLLEEAVTLAEERLADPRYQGSATDAQSYLYESMAEPSAYVVAGFGKAGTGDTVSPMPNILAGRIGLSEVEVRAVIAFLQALGGAEITVEMPGEAAAAEERPAEAEPRPPFATAEDAIAELACGACHKVAGEEGEFGPDLTRIGAVRDRDYLRRAILEPNAEIADGYEPEMMPEDYGVQLYAAELEMLLDYLAGLK
ncbi:MAG: c-type cytochrome [Gammaproteobacteria bacterium]|nr:c-type cytochrome [Gammaproteobacteria bacterium]NIT63121.1 c-type cytochrome [Gammaproteobacteria bacterium]NIW35930.1 c-type cytochrome [Gemmatimonadota bacterium]NIX10183.1 c-type cytochrome [Gammaproteobacteria bacterium]NIY31701.1 c-type cytochrome [Gammaproteobacteria bacterium]